MSKAILRVIQTAMDEMGLTYSFLRYKKAEIVYPYWVGSYNESVGSSEDGLQESSFTLDGFHRGDDFIRLEEEKEFIESYFDKVGGLTMIADNGNGVAISYGNAFPVSTGDDELLRIQINLNTKEWKVN